MIKRSIVKDYVSSKGMRTSADLFEKLDIEVKKHLDMAIRRAKENNRSTVQARDM